MKKIKSSFLKNHPILVTGGTGFIGSWLVKKLMDLEAKPVVLDIKSSSPILNSLSKKPIFVQGDVRDFSFVKKILKKYKISIVFHLAAQALVTEAYENPLLTLETNIAGTYNVLEASRQSKNIKKIIIFSSDKAYGDVSALFYKEEQVLKAVYPYDISKACADLISQMYFKSYNLPVCITRCGNIFGGGDLHFSRLVPGTILAAFQNKKPIIRSDGTLVRDYIYIDDIVDGLLKLTKAMEKKEIWGEAFNFGTSKPNSVLEVVEKTLQLMNKKKLSPKILNKAHHEIKYSCLSTKKSKKILNWKPKYSFEKSLERTIDWYVEHFKNNPKLLKKYEKRP